LRETCPGCGGRGRVVVRPCPACSGTGLTERRDRVRVRVPAGVFTGTELRLRGMGDAGRWGGPPGDLVVVTRVDDHPRFVRRGDAVLGELPLEVWQAALGAEVAVDTVDGPVGLRVPPGTQPGQEFSLPGRGVPNLKTGRRGDHVARVTVRIRAPRDEDERRAWQRLALAAAGELSPAGGL
jgi:molecular chaperone DnaJ